jgi:hypothetical protein
MRGEGRRGIESGSVSDENEVGYVSRDFVCGMHASVTEVQTSSDKSLMSCCRGVNI